MGKYQWNSGEVYTGEWTNGKMNGKGKIEKFGEVIFEGEFLKDKAVPIKY